MTMQRVHRLTTPLARFARSCKMLAVAVTSATLLTACTGDGMDDLRDYVAKQKAKPAGRIPPLPAFETFPVIPYSAAHLRDPFAPYMIAEDTGKPTNPDKPVGPIIQPPITHKQEPLEKFPLDGLKFVGLLERRGERWAIIMAPDKLVHRVKVGNYLGENYGKIVSISETKIELVETVSNGIGGWIESPATISVVE